MQQHMHIYYMTLLRICHTSPAHYLQCIQFGQHPTHFQIVYDKNIKNGMCVTECFVPRDSTVYYCVSSPESVIVCVQTGS